MSTKKIAPVAKVAAKSTKAPAKTSPKKVTVSKGKKQLRHAESEQAFWVTDGRTLSNLLELRDALASMTDDVFAHHVSKERNDFADWIEHVLQDVELASTFRKSKKPNTARDVVISHLRIYII